MKTISWIAVGPLDGGWGEHFRGPEGLTGPSAVYRVAGSSRVGAIGRSGLTESQVALKMSGGVNRNSKKSKKERGEQIAIP